MSDGAFLFQVEDGWTQAPHYGVYLGVKLHTQHPSSSRMTTCQNPFKLGDPMEPWKGRKSDDGGPERSESDYEDGIKW